MFCRHNASFENWIIKVQDFLNFELSPMYIFPDVMPSMKEKPAGQQESLMKECRLTSVSAMNQR